MSKKILQKDTPILRKKALEIPLDEIATPETKKIIGELKEALNSQEDGVAIAGPQIGYPLRIFVVSKKLNYLNKERGELSMESETEYEGEDSVYINPSVKKVSKDKKLVEEGCLSVRYLYGKVKRHTKTTVEAYDENGKKFIRGASGLLAQIFQHEIDHLDGVLFIDKAKDIQDMPPEKLSDNSKK